MIIIIVFQFCFHFYVSSTSVFFNDALHQAKYVSFLYVNSFFSNFYCTSLVNVSIFICFEIRRRYFNIYVRKFLYDDLSRNKIISRINEFLDFYDNTTNELSSHIRPIEKTNIISLIIFNVLIVMSLISLYNYNDSIESVLVLSTSIAILDLYYIITKMIIVQKRRVTCSIIASMCELRSSRQSRQNAIAMATTKETISREEWNIDTTINAN